MFNEYSVADKTMWILWFLAGMFVRTVLYEFKRKLLRLDFITLTAFSLVGGEMFNRRRNEKDS